MPFLFLNKTINFIKEYIQKTIIFDYAHDRYNLDLTDLYSKKSNLKLKRKQYICKIWIIFIEKLNIWPDLWNIYKYMIINSLIYYIYNH